MLALPYELTLVNAFSSYVMLTRFDPTLIPPPVHERAALDRQPAAQAKHLVVAAVVVVEVVDDALEGRIAAELEHAVGPDQDAAVARRGFHV